MNTTDKSEPPRRAARPTRGASLWRDAWRRLLKNRMAAFGGVVVGFMILVAGLAPHIAPHQFHEQVLEHQHLGPSLRPAGDFVVDRARARLERLAARQNRDLTAEDLAELEQLARAVQTDPVHRRRYLLGTDMLGRDLLTRMMFGARISMTVGVVATLVSLFIGVTYGSLAGLFGGRADNVMMRIVDVLYGLPFMFFVIILVVLLGRNLVNLFIALGAVQWLTMSRIVRGQMLSLKEKEFVAAARLSGVSGFGIVTRYLLPNMVGPIIVYATLTIPAVILEEAFLSFLGLGVQAPMASWGTLIAEGAEAMEVYPWMLIFPALSLAFLLFSMNFLGEGLRDALDPQLKNR